MIDLQAVSDAMLELEDRTNDPEPNVPVGVVAARILGLEHSEDFDRAMETECRRVFVLMESHYARMGVKQTSLNFAALAFVQGITFAAAVERVRAAD